MGGSDTMVIVVSDDDIVYALSRDKEIPKGNMLTWKRRYKQYTIINCNI